MKEKREYCEVVPSHKASLWEKMNPLLRHLDMELTERCNNNCIHCYINLPANDSAAKGKELPTNELQLILKEAASLGCLSVRLTGGEPLLREDFAEIYTCARKLGMKVLLFTNATLITPRMADLFSSLPPLEKIHVTLYGMKRTSYEAVTRTSGSHEAALRGINLLLDKKVPFIVRSVFLPSNREEVAEFEAWASGIPWMESEPSYSIFLDLRARRDSEKRNREIQSLRPSAEEGLMLLARRPERYLGEMKKFCSRFMRAAGPRLFSCGAGRGSACVDAYGMLQTCMLLRHPDTVYDLRNGTIRDAIETRFPSILNMEAKNPEYIEKCSNCSLKGLCEQCPAKSYMEHGALDRPVEYLCMVAHAQAEKIGIIQQGQKGWEQRTEEERKGEYT